MRTYSKLLSASPTNGKQGRGTPRKSALYLLRHHREHLELDAVEFVEAGPRAGGRKAYSEQMPSGWQRPGLVVLSYGPNLVAYTRCSYVVPCTPTEALGTGCQDRSWKRTDIPESRGICFK